MNKTIDTSFFRNIGQLTVIVLLTTSGFAQTLNPTHTGVIFRNENVHVNVSGAYLNVYGNVLLNNSNAKLTHPQGNIVVTRNWYNHASTNPIENLGSNGEVIFQESEQQYVSGDFETNFDQILLQKPSENLNLLQPVNVHTAVDFTQGNVISSTTSPLTVENGATAVNASTDSYVDGPITKVGNDAFTFPTGNTSGGSSNYLPIGISAPNNVSDVFTAQFFNSATPNSNVLNTALESVNDDEYWSLLRDVGTSQVDVTLSWNANSGVTNNNFYIKVAGYDGAIWQSYMGININTLPTNPPLNIITSIAPISHYEYFAIGQSPSFIAEGVLKKKLDGGHYLTTDDKLRFKFEEQYNDLDDNLTYNIYDDQNSVVLSHITTPLTVDYGDNRYDIDVSTLSAGFYVLEIINEKNEKWFLRFKR